MRNALWRLSRIIFPLSSVLPIFWGTNICCEVQSFLQYSVPNVPNDSFYLGHLFKIHVSKLNVDATFLCCTDTSLLSRASMSTTTKGGPLTVCALDAIFTFSFRNQSHMSPDKRRSRAQNPGWQSLLFLTNTVFLACTESIGPFPCEVIQPMISNKHVIVNHCNQTWTYGLSNPSSVPSVSPPKFSTFHEMSTSQSVAWLAMLQMIVKGEIIESACLMMPDVFEIW